MRRELVWTHNFLGQQTGVIGHGILELVTDQTLDGAETMTMVVPADHPKLPLLVEGTALRLRDTRWIIGERIQERSGARSVVRVECVASWTRLAQETRVGSVIVADKTVRAGAAQILYGTAWSVGPATPDVGLHQMEEQDITVLAAIRRWATITDRLLVFDTQARTVDLVTTRGVDVGLAFRRGRNIAALSRRHQPPTVTELHPFGADGLTIAGVNGGKPYLEDYTWFTSRGVSLAYARQRQRRLVVWSDPSILSESDLLVAAQKVLAAGSQGSETIEVSVVDISSITGTAEDLRPGDRVRALDPLIGDEFSATVTRRRRDWLAPHKGTIELSTSPERVSSTASTARPQASQEWRQFTGPVLGAYQVRNDGIYTAARVPLRFRPGGQAHMTAHLSLVGVGDGVATVSIYDSDDSVTLRSVDVPYVDGVTVEAVLSVALVDVAGVHDYRVRVTTVADGGPSTSAGVNIAKDLDGQASFWILAQGAVQESPRTETSVTFSYTGAVQSWTVPDGVTEVRMQVAAAEGGARLGVSGGRGGRVTGRLPVVPGSIWDVVVGGTGGPAPIAGWPNGGEGGDGVGSDGAPGAGGSWVTPTGSGLAGAVLVAGGGGGASDDSASPTGAGGDGSFFGPGNPESGTATGATQWGPGTGYEDGDVDGVGYGGDAPPGAAFQRLGGGGGGGWHGGGSGSSGSSTDDGHGGGGGSGFAAGTITDLQIEDGVQTGHGQVVISWAE